MSDHNLSEPLRIVSMDGGGIYGLGTAIMLRKLCERDESFLGPGHTWLFAGTSAGALNALLLAKEQNPRKIILDGELENFWREPGIYIRDYATDWYGAIMSFYGLTAWMGQREMLDVLYKYMGRVTLGELEQKVLIATFDWTGGRNETHRRVWGPKFFNNLTHSEPDCAVSAAEVGYFATSPPGFRPVRDGYGDGGVFVPDPAMCAVVEVIRNHPDDDRYATLSRIALLSLGVLTKMGNYGLANFDLGAQLFFSVLPTNPQVGNFYPPEQQISLDAPTEDVNHQLRILLDDRYTRLNPPVFGPPEMPPALLAMSLARFQYWRDWLVYKVTAGCESPEARRAVERGVRFLQSSAWRGDEVSPSGNQPGMTQPSVTR